MKFSNTEKERINMPLEKDENTLIGSQEYWVNAKDWMVVKSKEVNLSCNCHQKALTKYP